MDVERRGCDGVVVNERMRGVGVHGGLDFIS